MVPWVALVAVMGACSNPDAPRPLRLVDEIDAATIEGGLDDASRAAPAGREIIRGSLDALPATVDHEGAFVAELTTDLPSNDRAEEMTLRLIRVPVRGISGGIAIECVGNRPMREGELLFAWVSRGALDASSLRDSARVETMLRNNRPFLRPLRLKSGTETTHEVVVDPDGGESLLVGIIRFADQPYGGDLVVRRLSPQEEWRGASQIDRPHSHPAVRMVTIGPTTRESLVVAPPGSIRFDVVVPPAARLRVSLGLFFAEGPQPVEITVRGGDLEERLAPVLRSPGDSTRWRDCELPLDRFAGKNVAITLSAPALGKSTGGWVAFGSPTVETAPLNDLPLDVVLVSLDTVRADRLSIYGAPAGVSPNLASLAESSIVFDNAVAAAPWTLPSHATMMSGQYPDRHEAHAPTSRIASATPLLAEAFRSRGYETVAFTGGGYVNPEFGFARGFERYCISDPAFPSPEWVESGHANQVSRQLANSVRATRAELLEQLTTPRGRPLFLFVHTYAAHNYAAPARFLTAVGGKESELPPLLGGLAVGEMVKRYQQGVETGDDAERVAAERSAQLLYDASVAVADELLGAVVNKLRESGRLERTLLVVTSDHGEELFERGNVGHGQSLHEEQIRVPLLIRIPDVAARRVGETVSLVDLAPTLRDLCDLPSLADGAMDGRSLRTRIVDGTLLPPRPVLSRGNRRDLVQRALRSDRLKFIIKDQDDHSMERMLFHLKHDPRERSNLIESQPAEAERIEATLFELVESLQARRVKGESASMNAALTAKLRELGYLGDE